MLPEAVAAVAAAGGTAVVTAMATDTWDSVKGGVGRLFGRGDEARAATTVERLDRARAELTGLSGAELEQARDAQAAAWQTRLADLLEEHPEDADQVRALVAQVQANQSAARAGDHGVAAGGDVSIEASDHGVAAGTIEGSVSIGHPLSPGPGQA